MSVICALDRGSRSGPAAPTVGPAARAEWKPPRVEMALVAGYHPEGRETEWVTLGRHGGPVWLLTHARLFPCSPWGCRAARKAAEKLRDEHAPGAIDLIARVVVTGPWHDPEDVIEAWRFEGPKPQSLDHYPFE